jgi:hypothetical protein
LQPLGSANRALAARRRESGAFGLPQWRPDREGLRLGRPSRPFAQQYGPPPAQPRGRPQNQTLERNVLFVSALLILVSGACCLAVLLHEFGSPAATAPGLALQAAAVERLTGRPDADRGPATRFDSAGRTGSLVADTPAAMVARSWSAFAPEPAPVRLASLDTAPGLNAIRPRAPANIPACEGACRDGPRTALAEFATSPFPYEGKVPGSGKPFLDVVEDGRRGHAHGGHVFWADETYNDSHVLLHIPEDFDVNRPGVMIVFFHGHGATLARDVRDRQRVPQQVSASGINAVLVAPQFAVDAADSSAGRFWEPGGFDRFLDEAAAQLARLDGDPSAARKYAKMPIVLVAYSGGFAPALLTLDGGAKTRLRGLVLLDALYSGLDKFASWIEHHRSAFFVSAYTHYTRGHNADLEHMLSERDVAYDTELKPRPLPGSVTFLATGSEVTHRDFVTHAWVPNPIEELLGRFAEYEVRPRPSEPAKVLSPTAQNGE